MRRSVALIVTQFIMLLFVAYWADKLHHHLGANDPRPLQQIQVFPKDRSGSLCPHKRGHTQKFIDCYKRVMMLREDI